jgi:hypothetical protein
MLHRDHRSDYSPSPEARGGSYDDDVQPQAALSISRKRRSNGDVRVLFGIRGWQGHRRRRDDFRCRSRLVQVAFQRAG